MKKKNPHAVALGRKGGKAKSEPKGFAAMTKEEGDRIRKLALEAIWKKKRQFITAHNSRLLIDGIDVTNIDTL